MGWLTVAALLCGPGLVKGVAQDRYVEVRNGNVFVYFGAQTEYAEMVRDFSRSGFNHVLIGAPDRRPEGVEVIQSEAFQGGFTLAESTTLDMLISADRNPGRYAGLNPLAVKAILLAGARIGGANSAPDSRMDQIDPESGAGLINRSRSLEIFASGRRVAGSSASRPMGWDRSIVFSGHPNRYRFEIGEGGPWNLAAVLTSNPGLELSGGQLVGSPQDTGLVVSLRRLGADGAPGEVIATSRGVGSVGYLYLGTVETGSYILEVASSGDGLFYGIAWYAQRHGTGLPDGNADPVFLFRKQENSQPLEIGSRVLFSGTAFGALDSVLTVEFYADGRKIGESNYPEFEFSWIADRAGASAVYAVATDRYGNQVFSAVATVNVEGPGSQQAEVRGPVIPADLSGVYLGNFSGSGPEGWVALSVLSSGKASILGQFDADGYGFFGRDGSVEANGQFVFPSIRYVGQNSEGGVESTPGAVIRGTIDGSNIEGRFEESGFTLSAVRSGESGDFGALAGFVELGVLNREEGGVYFVVTPSGKIKGIVDFDGRFMDFETSVSTPGATAVDLGNGYSLLLDADDLAGAVRGFLSGPGGMNEVLMGLRDVGERRQKIVNISTRGVVSGGSGVLIAGFVVEGHSPKQVLIRAVGPSLSAFGVEGVAADPRLVVRKSSGLFSSTVAVNDDWDGASDLFGDLAARVGAFSLMAGELDAVVVLTLEPGVYTAEMSDSGRGGVGLIEVYDSENSQGPAGDRIINISTRGSVHGGVQSLVGGFVIDGTVPKRVLIRAVGPSLANLGVVGALDDARLSLDLKEGDQQVSISENDDWGDHSNRELIREAARTVGAFPLDDGSGDSAILILLKPGAYTATVRAFGQASGIVLLEMYEVDES